MGAGMQKKRYRKKGLGLKKYGLSGIANAAQREKGRKMDGLPG
jgi:hypothetical protein